MWSLGNEVSEANGDAHSLKTIKRLLERVKEVDDSRFVTMGMDHSSALAMGLEVMKRLLICWM